MRSNGSGEFWQFCIGAGGTDITVPSEKLAEGGYQEIRIEAVA